MTNNINLIDKVKSILAFYEFLTSKKGVGKLVSGALNALGHHSVPGSSVTVETLGLVARGTVLKLLALLSPTRKDVNTLIVIGYGRDFLCFLNSTMAEAWAGYAAARPGAILRNDLDCFEIPFSQYFQAREIYLITDLSGA